MPFDVFISYHPGDWEDADAVVGSLESAGFPCWIAPRNLFPGKPENESIDWAIQVSRVLVLVLTAKAAESQQVLRELELADAAAIPVLVFQVTGVRPSDVLTKIIERHPCIEWKYPLNLHISKLIMGMKQWVALGLEEEERRRGDWERRLREAEERWIRLRAEGRWQEAEVWQEVLDHQWGEWERWLRMALVRWMQLRLGEQWYGQETQEWRKELVRRRAALEQWQEVRESWLQKAVMNRVVEAVTLEHCSNEPQMHRMPPLSKLGILSFYPKEVAPQVWNPFYAYIFRQSAVMEVENDVHQRLGRRFHDYRRQGESARQRIAAGAPITATPKLEGFQFNPSSLTLELQEDWHRWEFKLRAQAEMVGRASNGMLTFTVEGVIVADLPISIYVGKGGPTAETAVISGRPYQAIFCSYSHRDKRIVGHVQSACQALGMDYLRDVIALRSGQCWRDHLPAMIERADIFQLGSTDD